jgi:hypothetical protein
MDRTGNVNGHRALSATSRAGTMPPPKFSGLPVTNIRNTSSPQCNPSPGQTILPLICLPCNYGRDWGVSRKVPFAYTYLLN